VVLLLMNPPQQEGMASDFLLRLIAFVFVAYVFCIVPSALYAMSMEFWIRKGHVNKHGQLFTIMLSGILGAIGGSVVELLSYPFTQSSMMRYLIPDGAIVGFLTGLILVLDETRRQPPNISRTSE